jgi:hypothetical protein
MIQTMNRVRADFSARGGSETVEEKAEILKS